MNLSSTRNVIGGILTTTIAVGIVAFGLTLLKDYHDGVKRIAASTQFTQKISNPPCAQDYRDLPVVKLMMHSDGVITYASAFLVAKDLWVTADHVIPKDTIKPAISIITDSGEIAHLRVRQRFNDIDILLLEGNSGDIEPIQYLSTELGTDYLDKQFWHVGFPTIATGTSVLTSGNLLGADHEHLFYNMLALSGMSGGLTMMCDNNTPVAVGTISAFAYNVVSNRKYVSDSGEIIEEMVKANTGESFSAPIFQIIKEIEENFHVRSSH